MRNRISGSVCLGLSLFSSILVAQDVQNWAAPPHWVPGASAASTASSGKGPESAAAVGALAFHAVTPCRVIDTRGNGFSGQYGPPAMPAFSPRNFTIGGQCGVPVSAAAVSFNFAVTSLSTGGNLIVYPQGGSPPTTSSLHWDPADVTISNAAVIGLGAGSGIGVSVNGPSNAGSVDLIVDVNGYYRADPSVTPVNTLFGEFVLAAGTNASLTPSGRTLTLSAPVPEGPPGASGAEGTVGPQGSIEATDAVEPTGATGAKELSWLGAWTGFTAYAPGDAVSFNGSSYVSLILGNLGNAPDASPAAWRLAWEKGGFEPSGPATQAETKR